MGNTILATITALSLGLTCVVSAGSGAGCRYVDADGNGVCDYAGSGVCNYVDADGDGICDYAGNACGHVDADGDGICDYCGRYHRGGPVWNETNFVDTDPEDVYNDSMDYAARPAAGQRHCGQGRGHGSRGRCGR